ncbi:Sulfotransferase [Melia azedarach]|uniref:Sulfotransferase n=1 Tax=Melia azedarach TaxID=155640 RepID=A0ACC1X7U4_MELAZ|nr:Sulfotransferase [Melia azedarach]
MVSEVEYRALIVTTQEITWLHWLLSDMDAGPTYLACNNSRTIVLRSIFSLDQPADLFTKSHHRGAITTSSQFNARDDDILLTSSMKTCTTWLKALIFQIFKESPNPDLSGMCSARLFRTHLPYPMLPESVKTSGYKIVYITRNPKDTFVSLWHFFNASGTQNKGHTPLNEAFENFYKGVHPFEPFHDYVLGYWKESVKKPDKILFLKYEDMKRDIKEQVKRSASFIGRPFVKEQKLDKVL